MTHDWTSLAVAVSRRHVPCEILRERGADVCIARVPGPDGAGVIVKLWNRPDWRGALRRLTRTNPGAREWRTLRTLHAAGVRVPAAQAYRVLRGTGAAHTEALIVEDLGRCRDTTEELKSLIRAGDALAVRGFEDTMIDATRRMIDAGLLDHDHRLPNFVTTPDGTPVRLDFELVCRVRWPRAHPHRLGIMLGTLVGSHAFAVQPDTTRTVEFARRLAAAVRPPTRALRVARAHVHAMLARQQREKGIQTRVDLPWP